MQEDFDSLLAYATSYIEQHGLVDKNGNRLLHWVAKGELGNLQLSEQGWGTLVRVALFLNESSLATNDNGDTPMHWAMVSGRSSITQALLEFDSRSAQQALKTVNANGETPLLLAISIQDCVAVDVLLASEPDRFIYIANTMTHPAQTALDYAERANNTYLIKRITPYFNKAQANERSAPVLSQPKINWSTLVEFALPEEAFNHQNNRAVIDVIVRQNLSAIMDAQNIKAEIPWAEVDKILTTLLGGNPKQNDVNEDADNTHVFPDAAQQYQAIVGSKYTLTTPFGMQGTTVEHPNLSHLEEFDDIDDGDVDDDATAEQIQATNRALARGLLREQLIKAMAKNNVVEFDRLIKLKELGDLLESSEGEGLGARLAVFKRQHVTETQAGRENRFARSPSPVELPKPQASNTSAAPANNNSNNNAMPSIANEPPVKCDRNSIYAVASQISARLEVDQQQLEELKQKLARLNAEQAVLTKKRSHDGDLKLDYKITCCERNIVFKQRFILWSMKAAIENINAIMNQYLDLSEIMQGVQDVVTSSEDQQGTIALTLALIASVNTKTLHPILATWLNAIQALLENIQKNRAKSKTVAGYKHDITALNTVLAKDIDDTKKLLHTMQASLSPANAQPTCIEKLSDLVCRYYQLVTYDAENKRATVSEASSKIKHEIFATAGELKHQSKKVKYS